ncbi:MAG TPA: MlaD family protein [Candidatus Binatia bacterium]|nr:MlaD family protein [Candidatus Binatia bacterium]
MSKRANPALIGAFVVGAAAIAAAGALVIGSGRFFRSNVKFVCYFQGSVNGLDKGAPVKFRGVSIGTVSDIMLSLGERKGEVRIPVLIDIDKNRLRELGASQELVSAPGMIKKLAREQGLRAQLQQQSFITGQLFIGLDFVPDSPMELAQAEEELPYPEIPTLPTKLELAQAKIEAILDRMGKIDWESVGQSISSTVDGLNHLVNSPEVQANLVALRGALTEIRNAVGPFAKSATGATNELHVALQRLQTAIDRIDSIADPKAPLVQGITGALGEVGEAARSVRRLADDLDRDPSVLLRGKAR